MRIISSVIPDNSLIQLSLPKTSFNDCYSVIFQTDKNIEKEEAVISFFSNLRLKWIDCLFKLRQWLVRPFNLNSNDALPSELNKIEKRIIKGSKVSFFDVLEVTENEVLLFADDSHLRAWFSILVENNDKIKKLSFATTVQTKNRFGQFYLTIIKPFHVLIIKVVLKKVAKQFLQQK